MNELCGTAVLSRHPRAAAEARGVLKAVTPGDHGGGDAAELLLSEVVGNAVRYAKGDEIEVAVGFDEGTGVITGAVFDAEPGLGSGVRSCHVDEAEEAGLETGRGLDLLDMLAETWGVATVGSRGKWVWFQVPAAA
ncbi:ATP-binding protein [Streptomyces sp. NPDC047981]|uniref:ATP-binding protein n=1 Tax=Streptomyces sp. NPDC047981 TaxID=3154610 RepID=UPI0034406365